MRQANPMKIGALPSRSGASGGAQSARGLRRDGVWPWIFLFPTLLGVGVFYVWPVIQTFYFSFTEWGVFGGSKWTGLDNYQRLYSEPRLGKAMLNTAVYAAILLLGVPLAATLAALINRPGLRFRTLFRMIYFLPVVTLPVAIAIVWRLMFSGDFGVVNYFLSKFGVPNIYWLSTPGLALVTVGLVGIWLSLGLNMVILSAGLSSIPADLYEAAELDGASQWRQFRSITLPLLSPSLFFVTILTVIAGFKVFDIVFIMLPPTAPIAQESQTLMYLFYQQGFMANDKGYAAAVGMFTLFVILCVTAVQFAGQKRWVHYG